MTRGPVSPSPRLLRAVAAERADLRRRRTELLERRRRLEAELAELDGTIDELDERIALIDRLAREAPPRDAAVGDARPGRPAPIGHDAAPADASRLLRGPAIRAAAVRVLRARPERPEALHYREWFALLTDAGYTVAGKDPLAVFLTQLSRSPLVCRGTQSGTYGLDLHAPDRLRRRLEELEAQLRRLAAAPRASTTDLGSVRSRRTALTLEIGKVERALEEAEATLRPAAPGLAAAS